MIQQDSCTGTGQPDASQQLRSAETAFGQLKRTGTVSTHYMREVLGADMVSVSPFVAPPAQCYNLQQSDREH